MFDLQERRDLVCRLLLGSEEHTSELQSRRDLVCRLLLGTEKHTSELQSRRDLVCRLLLKKNKTDVVSHTYIFYILFFVKHRPPPNISPLPPPLLLPISAHF